MKRIKSFFYTLSVKYIWLSLFTLITICSILICNIASLSFQNSFRNALINIHNTSNQELVTRIDSDLVISSHFSNMLAASDEIIEALSISEDTQTSTYIKYNSLSKTFMDKWMTSTIDHCFIYFPQDDKIVTPTMVTTPSFYYNIYKPISTDFDKWYSDISAKGNSSVFFGDILVDSVRKTVSYYINTISLPSGAYCNIVLLNNIDTLSDTNIVVYQDDKPIYSNPGFQVPKDFSPSTYKTNKIYNEDNTEEYIIYTNSSGTHHRTYAFFTPTHTYLSEFKTIRNAMNFYSILALVICILLSLLFSNATHKPLKSVISMFDRKDSSNQNEFKFLLNCISDTLFERNELYKKSKDNDQQSLLLSAMNGNLPYCEASCKALADNNITFKSNNIIVAACQVDNFERLFPDNKYINSKTPLETVQFVIQNVAKDILATTYDYYPVCDNKLVLFIIDVASKTTSELIVTLKEMRNKLSNLIEIDTTIAISDTHTDIFELKNAYSECAYALDYQKLYATTQTTEHVIIYKDIISLNHLYSYTDKDEKKLINAILSADIDLATQYINEIFNNNIHAGLSPELVNLLIYSLSSTLLKVASTMPIAPLAKTMLVTKLANHSSIVAAHENIVYAIRLLCDCVPQTDVATISSQVIKIIDECYNKSSLSVADIGSRLNKNSSYLSRIFKKETGENLLSYINKVRIMKSKELLSSTSLNIKEIAEATGFISSTVFISTFKKYEGITPGQYKQVLLQETDDSNA